MVVVQSFSTVSWKEKVSCQFWLVLGFICGIVPLEVIVKTPTAETALV